MANTGLNEKIELLNGCEITSIEFEGVVSVQGRVVTRAFDGEKIRMNNAKWLSLWEEYLEEEGLGEDFRSYIHPDE